MGISTYISQIIGLPENKIIYLMGMYISFPFAFILNIIISKDLISIELRQVYCSVISVIILIFMYGWSSIHPFFLILFSYWLICHYQPKKVTLIATLYAMCHLCCCHIIAILTNRGEGTFGVTTTMMILLQRTTLLALYYEDMSKKVDNKKLKISFNDFVGYCLFFPTILVGPAIDFTHYKDAITGCYLKKYIKETNGRYPAVAANTLRPLLLSVLFYIVYYLGCHYFPVKYLISREATKTKGFLFYLLYLHLSMVVYHCMFYGTWILIESYCNLCYMGFQGLDNKGNEDWTACRNANALNFELSKNVKDCLDNWNIRTHYWLKKVIHERVTSSNAFMTFVISGIWHGLYPHYAYLFIMCAFADLISRHARKKIRPYFQGSKRNRILYDIIMTIMTQLCLSYHFLIHLLMNFGACNIIYRKLFYIGHIQLLLGSLIIVFP